jgi:hypothetical protein
MIEQGLVDRITRLPAQQRLELIELLTRSLHDELATEAPAAGSSPAPRAAGATAAPISDLAAIERLARSLNLDVPPDSALHQLRGSVPSAAIPISKEDVRDVVADYLAEKHS